MIVIQSARQLNKQLGDRLDVRVRKREDKQYVNGSEQFRSVLKCEVGAPQHTRYECMSGCSDVGYGVKAAKAKQS